LFINERIKAYDEIDEILRSYPIVIFIRGTPEKTDCKSSKVLV
jgi:glutaredoxin-related protein